MEWHAWQTYIFYIINIVPVIVKGLSYGQDIIKTEQLKVGTFQGRD